MLPILSKNDGDDAGGGSCVFAVRFESEFVAAIFPPAGLAPGLVVSTPAVGAAVLVVDLNLPPNNGDTEGAVGITGGTGAGETLGNL